MYFDAMVNIYLGIIRAIRGEIYIQGEFPTMKNSVGGLNSIESAI